ncbi:ankyrin repeat domain-containing protein [Planctomycetaceae bacterium SH139]
MLPKYALLEAIRFDCTADFERALERGATLDARDYYQRSAVEIAFRFNSVNSLRRFIQLGADPNPAIGKRGERLIHAAARDGNHDTLTALLEAGVDLNQRGVGGKTPLHLLCERNYEYLAEILLRAVASPHVRANKRQTPLHIASQLGHLGLVRILVNSGANPLAENRSRFTAIHEAAKSGQQNIVNFFIQMDLYTPAKADFWIRIAHLAENNGNTRLAEHIYSTFDNLSVSRHPEPEVA